MFLIGFVVVIGFLIANIGSDEPIPVAGVTDDVYIQGKAVYDST